MLRLVRLHNTPLLCVSSSSISSSAEVHDQFLVFKSHIGLSLCHSGRIVIILSLPLTIKVQMSRVESSQLSEPLVVSRPYLHQRFVPGRKQRRIRLFSVDSDRVR